MNIGAILALIAKLGGVVQIGKVLWALPKLYRFVKRFGPIAGDLFKHGKLPAGKDSLEFLRAAADLIRCELVDFPGVDEADLAKKIDQLASEFEDVTKAGA